MASKSVVSDVVAARVRDLRTRRGLTVAGLAARCADLGAPELTAQTLYRLETPKDPAKRRPRPISVDELFALALALNVAPVHLLVPTDGDGEAYQVTATEVAEDRARARAWIRGYVPLARFPLVGDSRQFYAEIPRSETEAAKERHS